MKPRACWREHTRSASEKLRLRDELGETLPNLREQETVRAAVLQRMTLEKASLDEEEKRVEGRIAELKQRRQQANADVAREEGLLADTDGVISRLATEKETLLASANEGTRMCGRRLRQLYKKPRKPWRGHRKRRMKRPTACRSSRPSVARWNAPSTSTSRASSGLIRN